MNSGGVDPRLVLALACIDAQAALKHGRATITVDAADFLSIAESYATLSARLDLVAA